MQAFLRETYFLTSPQGREEIRLPLKCLRVRLGTAQPMNSSPPPLKQARDGCNTQEKLKTILIESFFFSGGGGVQAQYPGQYESD